MRTETTLSALIAALTSNYGDMYDACCKVGVSLMFVAQWRKDDAKVHEQLAEAERVGAMRIESAALQRAVHGHTEPVFYQGEECGSRTVHHDGLMAKILEARVPGYRKGDDDGARIVVNGGQVQINNMPRAESYEQWLQMRTATLALRDRPALPPPDNDIIDVEAIPVEDNPLARLVI
jgi:hypothetical protein